MNIWCRLGIHKYEPNGEEHGVRLGISIYFTRWFRCARCLKNKLKTRWWSPL